MSGGGGGIMYVSWETVFMRPRMIGIVFIFAPVEQFVIGLTTENPSRP